MTEQGLQEGGDEAGAWRPLSLRPIQAAWPSRRARLGILATVLLGHGLLALWLPWLDRSPPQSQEEALVVGFVPRPPLSLPPPEPTPAPESESRRRSEPRPRPRKRSRPVAQQALQAQPPDRTPPRAPPAQRIEFYDEAGRIKVPTDMLEQIDRKFGDTRTFDYQVPGMDRAEKLLHRPPPIAFERTRFDEHWKPDQDLLTDLLSQMVEKTTKEVRVRIPGRSQSTIVCNISLLALGGGCGLETPGSDYVGPVDDPNTLSPEEDRQCQAWWEQIVGASTQEAWRKTRKLYEAQCRKPRERAPAG